MFNVYILSLCGSVNLGLRLHILRFPWIDTLFTHSWSNAHKSNISHILHSLHKNVKLGIYCRLVSLSVSPVTLSLVLGISLELLVVSDSLCGMKCQLNFVLFVHMIHKNTHFTLNQMCLIVKKTIVKQRLNTTAKARSALKFQR